MSQNPKPRRVVPTLFPVLALAALPLLSCNGGDEPDVSGAKEIYVSFPPLADFTKRIVGDSVAVHCPVPAGQNPATWSPSRDEITLFQNASMVVVHGAELERWVGKASLPASSLVDVSAGLADQYVKEVHPGHTHGAEGPGTHEHIDPHVWTDPSLAKLQAKAILDAVVKRHPDLEKSATGNYEALARELDDIDKRWKSLTAKLAGVTHYSSSKKFEYLKRRYGFTFRDNLNVSPSKALGDEALWHLTGQVQDEGPKILWWTTAPSEGVAKPLTERFAFKHLTIDLGMNAGGEAGGSYIDTQRKNLDRVEAVLASM